MTGMTLCTNIQLPPLNEVDSQLALPGAHQMEPPSPIQALGVRSLRRFRARIEERANENKEMTVVLSYVKQQAASALQKKWFYL